MRIFISFLALIFALNAENIVDFDTLKSEFVQSVTNDQNQSIVYKGTVWLKNPDFALWKYQEPIEKYIYINGTKVIIVEPELFQATSLESNQILNIITAWKKSKVINQNRRVVTINNNKITITHNDKFITMISYKDELDNSVEIALDNSQKNIALDQDFFKAKIPQDYDLVIN